MTVEGLEGAHPLAHFRGVNLPMALTPAQCNDLARISGSALLSDWVGLTVILDPVESANGWTCVIRGPDEPTAPRPRRRPVFVLSPQVRRMLVFLLLALLVGLALQIEESRALWDWLVSLRVAN